VGDRAGSTPAPDTYPYKNRHLQWSCFSAAFPENPIKISINFAAMRNTVITFGIICFCGLVLLEMGQVAIIKNTLPVELAIGIFAGISFIAGILISRKTVNTQPAEVTPPSFTHVNETGHIDYNKVTELNISKREYEILCAIASGLSNVEIAEKLFVSESTIKTHVSNLLPKLNARRRTEAVRIAKELNIIN
jgi:DNA-binding CsgD family transcriptional regulator